MGVRTLVHIGHFSLTWNPGPLLLTESDGTGIIMYTVPMPGPLPPKKTMGEASALIIHTYFANAI